MGNKGEQGLPFTNDSCPGSEGKKGRARMQVYVALGEVSRSLWPNGLCRNRGGGSVRHTIKPRSDPYDSVKNLVPCV